MIAKIICPEEGCSHQSKLYNLKVHLKACHKYSDIQIDIFVRRLKEEKANDMGSGTIECEECGDVFLSKSGFNKHRRTKHVPAPEPTMLMDPGNISIFDETFTEVPSLIRSTTPSDPKTNGKKAISCPECKLSVKSQSAFCDHYAEKHSTDETRELYSIHHMSFTDKASYQVWIESRCKETLTAFATDSSQDNGGRRTTYKKCRHVGNHARTSTIRLGHLSVKEVPACTAFLKMSVVGEKVTVDACFGHVEHTRHAAVLPLTILERDKLSSLIQSGVPDDKIIDQVRNTQDIDDRMFYTTTADLRNIREKRELHPGRKAKDDIESVRLRYLEKAYDDGIRQFQPPIDPSGKGFALVIINPTQLDWIKTYGHRGIILDDTHNTTRYGLHLTTLMVVDNLDRGLPSGFLLSSGNASTEVEKLLMEIKNLLPDFDCAYVMTDEANAFWNAYVKVFPNTGAQKVTCRYHIYMSWKKNCKEKLKGASSMEHAQVTKKLRQIIRLADETSFRRAVAELFTFLNSKGFEEFSQYLNSYYMTKIDEWATFSRKGVIAQTSMYCEAWHSRLKGAMGKEKGNMRIDRLLHLLINSVRVIEANNLVNECRGLSKVSSRAQLTLAEHRKAIAKYGQKTYLITGNGNLFEVGSTSSNMEYKVEKVDACHCSEANTHCPLCHACSYDWQCSCLQQMAGVVCCHVHAVVMVMNDNRDEEEEDDDFVQAQPIRRTVLDGHRVDRRPEIIDDNRKDIWIENRALYNRADELMKKLVYSQSNTVSATSTLRTFTEDIQQAIKKMETALKEQGLRETESIAARPEKRRTGQGGNIEKDLPISLTQRSKILQRRRENKQKKDYMNKADDISFLDSEIEVCSICFQADVELPSDCDESEDAMLTTRWLRCDSCRQWAHYECGSSRTDRLCVACAEGHYTNDIGEDVDDSE